MAEPRRPQRIVSGVLLYAVIPLLLAYFALILVSTYLAQENLREASQLRSELELENRANALGYFYSERRTGLRRLAEDRAFSVFFSNRALGMSMRYGLRASLLGMQKVVDRFIVESTLGDRTSLQRVVIRDTDGQVLLDRGENTGQAMLPKALLPFDNAHQHLPGNVGAPEKQPGLAG